MYQGQSIQVTKLDGGIAELCFDNKTDSVNKFDLRTVTELGEAAKLLAADGSLTGLLVTSGKDVFIVGADITEFGANFQKTERSERASCRERVS
jgi:3-hydroxyacyl-CoA dehydrogenase/enoyl-CoA hydratase/3-hydroxybutyryl-CoA epimerase/enoyl-CoA isomerase